MVFHSRSRKAMHSLVSQIKHILAPNMANAFPSLCHSQMYNCYKSEGTLLLPTSSLSSDKYQNDTDLLFKSSDILQFSENIWFGVFFSVMPLLIIIYHKFVKTKPKNKHKKNETHTHTKS